MSNEDRFSWWMLALCGVLLLLSFFSACRVTLRPAAQSARQVLQRSDPLLVDPVRPYVTRVWWSNGFSFAVCSAGMSNGQLIGIQAAWDPSGPWAPLWSNRWRGYATNYTPAVDRDDVWTGNERPAVYRLVLLP